MFPFVYEFHWAVGHLIFLGIFFSVVIVVAFTMVSALLRSRKDLLAHATDGIAWKSDFGDLPQSVRVCRHQLAGEVAHRVCSRGFECRTCDFHKEIQSVQQARGAMAVPEEEMYGFAMPSDRFYHRGHTWVKKGNDGMLEIGLDDFGKRVLGTPDSVDFPAVGTMLHANGTGCYVRKNGVRVRMLSPVDGELVAVNEAKDAWTLKVKGMLSEELTGHLLHGTEVRGWMMKEIERLQMAFAGSDAEMTLADGGEVIADLPAAVKELDWSTVWGKTFLQP